MTKAASIKMDDILLIERCRRGDSVAMERLILTYQDRIYNVILRMCGNADDAAELTQDTFVKIIESIDGFAGRSSFYTWAFRIAVNITLNYCQRLSKFGHRSLDVGEDEFDGQTKAQLKSFLCDHSSPEPSEAAQNNELFGLVEVALAKMDEHHRAVVILRDIEGMSYDEIASVLNIELGTVKSRLSRAREHLREYLERRLK